MTGKLSTSWYLIVGVALLVLTLSTYLIAMIDLGRWNLVIALVIAAAKGTLIALYFMHARYARPVVWLAIIAGLLWLGILFNLTLTDYVSRVPSM